MHKHHYNRITGSQLDNPLSPLLTLATPSTIKRGDEHGMNAFSLAPDRLCCCAPICFLLVACASHRTDARQPIDRRLPRTHHPSQHDKSVPCFVSFALLISPPCACSLWTATAGRVVALLHLQPLAIIFCLSVLATSLRALAALALRGALSCVFTLDGNWHGLRGSTNWGDRHGHILQRLFLPL